MGEEFQEEADARMQARRRRRNQEMRRRRKRQRMIRMAILGGVALLLVIGILCLIIFGVRSIYKKVSGSQAEQTVVETQVQPETQESIPVPTTEAETEPETTASGLGGGIPGKVYEASADERTTGFNDEVISSYGILVDPESKRIVAQRDANARISPASMTKILTLLVAAEHVTNLEDTFTITVDITDYAYRNDCSSVGFAVDEVVTVKDLFYGTILPSGGDAALGLATYVAGSQEAFVELMNQKLQELGLSDTAHFTNCVGLYDDNHYCTVYDMAMILEAAMDNEFCREVLSAHTYTTSSTAEHPEGITVSNWFLRRIEDKDTSGTVVGAKTGYVLQSGNCAASYAEDANGKGYICVTANATSSWKCIYDHVAVYKKFLT